MTKPLHRRLLAFVAVPFLVATAGFAQDTPSAPATSSPSGQTPEQKAHQDELARLGLLKERAQAEKAVAEAQKAASDARAAATTSSFGPLANYKGTDGTVTVDSANRSILEATLLSTLALREAADEMAPRLCNVARGFYPQWRDDFPLACTPQAVPSAFTAAQTAPRPAVESLGTVRELCAEATALASAAVTTGPRPIVIVPEATRNLVEQAELFEVRSAGLARELCDALAAAESLTARSASLLVARGTGNAPVDVGGGTSLTAVSAAVNTVANLLRSDYTVYGIDVAEDQNLLVRELARAFLASGLPNPVFTPGLFPVSASRADNPALRRLAILDRLRGHAVSAAQAQAALSQRFALALPSAGDDTAQVRDAQASHDAAKTRIENSVKAYDAFVTSLTTSSGTEPPPLVAIIRQANTVALLRSGGLLVLTNVHFMGGTAYTQRNFFTFLGGMPYHVSGGVLVSYAVEDGVTGQLYDAIAVPMSGGYVRPTELRRHMPRSRRR